MVEQGVGRVAKASDFGSDQTRSIRVPPANEIRLPSPIEVKGALQLMQFMKPWFGMKPHYSQDSWYRETLSFWRARAWHCFRRGVI